MAKKRRWELWIPLIIGKINGISGLVTVLGTALAFASSIMPDKTTEKNVLIVGIVLIALSLIYVVFTAIPPYFRRAEDLVGKAIDISELDSIYPPILTMAIVGYTQAGKTTLKNRLSVKVAEQNRTQSVTAFIISMQMTPPKYIAIFDGGGEQFSQQFEISKSADCLCFVLDHNISDVDTKIDQKRLHDHTDFLNQVRWHLIHAKCARKKWISILINKRDLWEKADALEKIDFEAYCDNEVNMWKSGNFAESVNSYPYSNENSNDIAKFMSQIVAKIMQ